MRPIKVCSCGLSYKLIPKSAKLDLKAVLPGYYFNCSCGSTLVIPSTFMPRFKMVLLVLASVLLAACGSDKGKAAAPAGPEPVTCSTLQGRYYDQYSPADTLDIAGNCTFTDSVCGYTASYTIPDETTGATVISVAGTNGTPGCMSSTSHMCVLEFNGVQLGINCDSGAHLFLFIKQ